MIRKLLLAGALAVASIGVIATAAVTSSGVTATAASATENCGQVYPVLPFKYLGVFGESVCNAVNPHVFNLQTSCVEVYTIYGWLIGAAPGEGDFTACNNAGSLDNTEYGISTCYSGTWTYRTLTAYTYVNTGSTYYEIMGGGTQITC